MLDKLDKVEQNNYGMKVNIEKIKLNETIEEDYLENLVLKNNLITLVAK